MIYPPCICSSSLSLSFYLFKQHQPVFVPTPAQSKILNRPLTGPDVLGSQVCLGHERWNIVARLLVNPGVQQRTRPEPSEPRRWDATTFLQRTLVNPAAFEANWMWFPCFLWSINTLKKRERIPHTIAAPKFSDGRRKSCVLVPTVRVCWGAAGALAGSGWDELRWRGVTFFCCPPWHTTSLSSDQSSAMNGRLATNPSGRGR